MKDSIQIIVTEPEYFTAESLSKMRRVGKVIAKRFPRPELLKVVKTADVLVVRVETKIDAELLRFAPKLKCLVSATTGLNHIDTQALKKRGIPIFSLHGTHSISTAEHALALLFAIARNIPAAHTHVKDGGWSRWKYIGTELTGKTLGIFGIGRIGTEVAKRAKGLGLKVIAYDPYLSKKEVAKKGALKVSFAALLKDGDFISIHAPLTEETKGIFDAPAFKKVKPSLIIVNSARGSIIQESALLSALKHKRIRGAALDVYPEEPLPAQSSLRLYVRAHDNLILTPHIAASTREAVGEASKFAANEILKFFK